MFLLIEQSKLGKLQMVGDETNLITDYTVLHFRCLGGTGSNKTVEKCFSGLNYYCTGTFIGKQMLL